MSALLPRVLLAIALALAAGIVGGVTTSSHAAVPALGHEGRWITDEQGRVVMIRGLQQFAANGELDGPLPFGHEIPADTGFGEDDARFMAAHGFNGARLSLSYWEYAPNRFDMGYLRGFREFVRTLDRAGVQSLLDMQQAIYGPRFAGGEGFPDWMTYTDDFPVVDAGYPRSYFANPAMNRAWDNWWANVSGPDGVPLWDHFAEGWKVLARMFRREPGVLGYDLINEPWPGNDWQSCSGLSGCPPGGFDEAKLSPMYERVATAVREVDRKHLIVYEPNLLFDFGADTRVEAPPIDGAVFGFHIYCLDFIFPETPGGEAGCPVGEERAFDQAEAHGEKTGNGLLLGEWGGPYSLADIERMVEMADDHLMGWMYWDYRGIVRDPTVPPDEQELDTARLELLERPYPQRTAGTPTKIGFDPDSGEFETSYSTDLPGGGTAGRRLTEIYVPKIHYPTGYSADVAGGTIVSSPNACILRVRADPGAPRVDVRVSRAEVGSMKCRPGKVQLTDRPIRKGRGTVRWDAGREDLPTWGYDVQRRVEKRWKWMRRESPRQSAALRARPRAEPILRVRAVDVAGSSGPWRRIWVRAKG